MTSSSLNDWYGISINTSKENNHYVSKGDIFRRDNNEPVETVSGHGITTTLSEQDARKFAYNRPVITVKPINWHSPS